MTCSLKNDGCVNIYYRIAASNGYYIHMVISENFVYVHRWDERTPPK